MKHKKAKKAKRMAMDALRMMSLEDQIMSAEATLQPVDGYINPMARIGVVRPTTYALGNMLNGATTQSVINPET
jgi:hypothetical protein